VFVLYACVLVVKFLGEGIASHTLQRGRNLSIINSYLNNNIY